MPVLMFLSVLMLSD